MTADPGPVTTPRDFHSLTLVLSMQRSGSTLLGRDIESLGGLGAPREHFRGLEDDAGGSPSESDLLGRLVEGADESDPGVTGVKVHIQQARAASRAITGRPAESATDAARTVVAWARRRFDKVLLVVLVRNAVDTAISHVVAKETGTYLSVKARGREAGGPLPEIEDLNPRILAELVKVLRQRAALNTIAKEHADLALLLTYEELSEQVESTTAKLVGHARERGFSPKGDAVARTLEKLISADQSEALRNDFASYLLTERGI